MAALSGYTVFTSYVLVPYTNTNLLGEGYSKSIHCNYIKSLTLNTEEPHLQEVVINFSNVNDFKFLSPDINDGIGYTVHKIFAIVQLLKNSDFATAADIKPKASDWKIYDLTGQISTHSSGDTISAVQLTQQAFKVPLKHYYDDAAMFPPYNIKDYLTTYPSWQASADAELCFGDETFFLGNVSTDIKATAYTLDIPILLDLDEFNSSTNSTWNSEVDKVVITEIGIYDADKNLVAIGKLNNPIQKDSTIARTIVFAIDF